MPEDMPEDMPEHMPEDMPGRMPEDMPDRMPEDMSDRMPEDMPVRVPVTKCINVMVGITRSKMIFAKYCSATTFGSASTTCCVRGIGSAWRTLERMRLVATPRRGPRIQKFVTRHDVATHQHTSRHSKWESICLVEKKVICGG